MRRRGFLSALSVAGLFALGRPAAARAPWRGRQVLTEADLAKVESLLPPEPEWGLHFEDNCSDQFRRV